MKDYSVFAEENRQEYADVLQALTEIPSPSYRENRIAELIKKLLCGYAEKSGYDQVHIYEDDICNVYCELGEAFEPGSECFAVTAHTDTVFPDMEGPLPFERDGSGRIYGLESKTTGRTYVRCYSVQNIFLKRGLCRRRGSYSYSMYAKRERATSQEVRECWNIIRKSAAG